MADRFEFGMWLMITGIIVWLISFCFVFPDLMISFFQSFGMAIGSLMIIIGTIIMFAWVYKALGVDEK